MRPRSLSTRLIISSALVSIVLLAATGVVLAGLFQSALERNFDARLRAVLDGLVANVEIDAAGNPVLSGEMADTRFTLPLSGWYWAGEGCLLGAGVCARQGVHSQRHQAGERSYRRKQ